MKHKPPKGWRYYSLTPEERNDVVPTTNKPRRWPPSRRLVLAILATVVVVTALLIIYFSEWRISVIGGVVALMAAVLAFLIALGWEWLGLGEKGTKTGLDLFQVLVAPSIPIAVAVVGYLVSESQNRSRLNAEEQRAQDEALQAYQDGMETLILEQALPSSEEDDEVSTSARARTLTTLARVDAARQRDVVRFLYESQLIGYYRPALERSNGVTPAIDKEAIVRLAGADLSGADLSGAPLPGANLSGVDLSGADLRDARLRRAHLVDTDLTDADLRDGDDVDELGAILSDADLSGADLSGADLSRAGLGGAILTGGS